LLARDAHGLAAFVLWRDWDGRGLSCALEFPIPPARIVLTTPPARLAYTLGLGGFANAQDRAPQTALPCRLIPPLTLESIQSNRLHKHLTGGCL
jgi:hypothetical protein